ncbi:MAG: DUF4920 domain-containing protein [Ignavibacteriales bacterium]|nr:DUF4920 domain-containing protein [Ignavibacteriales bacterium]MCF8314887.1 DUF4920 domain-containing protein [Ignavibacteriales bacterium]MCF8436164.1 DUF4920 domain-containing protein [Ignavibacteriales bacterium]
MRKFQFLALILGVTILINAGDGKQFGEKLSLNSKTSVSEILAHPEKYDGKTVQVEGTVVNVCSSRGCWIELTSDKPYQTIKVKVNDGEIVFPMEAKGKKAKVEGVVYAVETEKKVEEVACSSGDKKEGSCTDKVTDASHEKENEAGCCSSSKTAKVYQIKGKGAIVFI